MVCHQADDGRRPRLSVQHLGCMGFALLVDAVNVMQPPGLYGLTTMHV